MEGEEIFIDKISLEDCIKFQKIEFEIIDGYYYDEGRNYEFGSLIEEIYETRKKYKKEKNAIQEVYKLIMNSAYGKSILKPIDTETRVITQDKIENYISMNYNHIKSIIQVGSRYLI